MYFLKLKLLFLFFCLFFLFINNTNSISIKNNNNQEKKFIENKENLNSNSKNLLNIQKSIETIRIEPEEEENEKENNNKPILIKLLNKNSYFPIIQKSKLNNNKNEDKKIQFPNKQEEEKDQQSHLLPQSTHQIHTYTTHPNNYNQQQSIKLDHTSWIPIKPFYEATSGTKLINNRYGQPQQLINFPSPSQYGQPVNNYKPPIISYSNIQSGGATAADDDEIIGGAILNGPSSSSSVIPHGNNDEEILPSSHYNNPEVEIEQHESPVINPTTIQQTQQLSQKPQQSPSSYDYPIYGQPQTYTQPIIKKLHVKHENLIHRHNHHKHILHEHHLHKLHVHNHHLHRFHVHNHHLHKQNIHIPIHHTHEKTELKITNENKINPPKITEIHLNNNKETSSIEIEKPMYIVQNPTIYGSGHYGMMTGGSSGHPVVNNGPAGSSGTTGWTYWG